MLVKKSDGTPLEGVAVSVDSISQSAATGPDGVHDFGQVDPGTYTVTAQKDAFSPPTSQEASSPASQTLDAPAGTSTQFVLTLDPSVARMSVHVQKQDGTAVEGATVSVDGKGWSGITDAGGNFDFGEVPADTYTISSQKEMLTSASQTQAAPVRTSTQFTLTMNEICKITSVTVATSPPDRARTRIGVGEEVDLTVSPAPATWAITSGSGTLSPNSGSQTTVRFTADDNAADVTITATRPTCSCTITFTVVQPASVTMERKPGTVVKHTKPRPDCGWLGKQWIHPNDVNFYNIERREVDSTSVCTGSYKVSYLEGAFHGNYAGGFGPWSGVNVHDPAKGSQAAMTDTIFSGYAGTASVGTAPPFNVGTMFFPIVYQWRVAAGTPHNLPEIRQEHEVFSDGRCESRKGGNTESAKYDDATGSPF